MKKFIKENLVLVSGIALPVLLVAGFFVLTHVPKAMLEPPQHDFLLAAYRYDYQQPPGNHLSFDVKGGRLVATVTPPGDSGSHVYRQHASIFRYSSRENRFSEIAFELPEELDEIEDPAEFPVSEVAELELDKRAQSPDGYTFEFLGYRSRGGLLGEIFGMGRRHDNQYVLKKNSAYFDLPKPTPDGYYYGENLRFIGWVTNGKGAS